MASEIAIATSTFYRKNPVEEIRMKLALESAKLAADFGYKLIAVDGGSPADFVKSLKDYGAIVEQEKQKGMGSGRRQAISRALELGEIISYTEPEKAPYISQIEKTAKPIREKRADIVVPSRGPLDSYPTSQRHAENFGNDFFKELTGRALDMWSGPRTFSRECAPYFLNYNGQYGDLWDAIFIPVIDAIHDGKRVISVDIEYKHPKEQTETEEGNVEFTFKRLKQLDNLMPALMTHWNLLNPKK